MSKSRNNKAVAEVIGGILLLFIAAALIGIVYISLMSQQAPIEEPATTLIGKMETGNIVIEHRRGEPLGLDTEIFLRIAGQALTPEVITAGDYLDSESKADGEWNIGERVVYPSADIMDIHDLEVNVKIVDIETNSMLLWGVLQEGYVIPSGGRGGIWHFDEGEGSTTYDSSGNNNNGNVHGANWTSGINGSALSYNGLDDYVVVPDSPGLHITDAITVEVWMNPVAELILDNLTLDENFCYNPHILHVADDVFVIVYVGNTDDGILKTFTIAPNGTMSDTPIDKLIFDAARVLEPRIIHVSGDIYAIVYEDPAKDDGILKTIEIFSDGQINNTIKDSLTWDTKTIVETDIAPSMIFLSILIFMILSFSLISSW